MCVFVFVCGECLLGWLAAADGATFNSGGGGDGGGGGGVSRIGGHDERERTHSVRQAAFGRDEH